jgi:hypothetical protein
MDLSSFKTGETLTENEFAQYGCVQSGSVVESGVSSFQFGSIRDQRFLKPRAHVSRRNVERGSRNERFIRLPRI